MEASKSVLSHEEEKPSLTPAEGNPVTIAATSIKLPPFWPADPHIWFAQVEAQFATRRITTQKTMYDYVVASLTPDFATEVRDLILTTPEDNPYDTLKAQLIKRTAASEQRRLQQLLHSEELGDRKPPSSSAAFSSFWGTPRHISHHHFSGSCSSSGYHPMSVWSWLLHQITYLLRNLLSLQTALWMCPLQQWTQSTQHPCLSLITSGQRLSGCSHWSSSLAGTDPAVRRHSSSSSCTSSPRQPSSLCWYHFRFGDSARKCKPPCSKSGNEQASR